MSAPIRDWSRAIEWMAAEPKCANQAFNIANGHLIRWENLSPKLARVFEIELARQRHMSPPRLMADKG
jgi:hypothetical protein